MCQESHIRAPHGLWANFHLTYVQSRRTQVLARRLIDVIPEGCSTLDVGCGDGQISRLIQLKRPDIEISGIDIIVRDTTYFPVSAFDGTHIPATNGSQDVVMLVDVLHHCDEPETLIKEARRVARKAIVIKDVMNDGFLTDTTLRFMDIAANRRYNVPCPFNFWRREKWLATFSALDVHIAEWRGALGLYPWPLNLLFERSMHFITRLDL